MEFIAQKVDLDIELTTLSGEKKSIPYEGLYSAEALSMAVTKIGKEDTEFRRVAREEEGGDHPTGAQHVARQLASIYNVPAEFWLTETDYATLVAIKNYFLETVTALRESGRS